MTPYNVSLAWEPSTDKSGNVTYRICCAHVSSETFPGPASTHVYQAGLEPGQMFSLRIFARDAAGNTSGYSNYDVYVNGVFDHSLMGYGQTVVQGNASTENTFQVIAVDSAGNQSAPATLTTCAVVFC